MKRHLPAIAAGTALQLLSIAIGAILLLTLAACAHQPPIQHGAVAPASLISHSGPAV